MATVYILVGAPASGKSTYAKEYLSHTKIVSTDAIRKELYGDESIQGNGNKVFSFAYARMRAAAKSGIDVTFDATSMTVSARKRIMEKAPIGTKFVAIVFERCEETLLENNNKRDRHVPEFVIKKMLSNYVRPTLEEGFSEVIFNSSQH